MLTFTSTPMGGVGEAQRPSRPVRGPGCGNDHRNPERAGDCTCADLAAELASRLSGECGWTTAEECQASARRCAAAGERYRCRIHPCLATAAAMSHPTAKLDVAS